MILSQAYPGIMVVGKHLGDGEQWAELLGAALSRSAPFVLVARDVADFLGGDEWVNLRRSLRLLQDNSVAVVAGASRDPYFYLKMFRQGMLLLRVA